MLTPTLTLMSAERTDRSNFLSSDGTWVREPDRSGVRPTPGFVNPTAARRPRAPPDPTDPVPHDGGVHDLPGKGSYALSRSARSCSTSASSWMAKSPSNGGSSATD
jgi:hypothetical protein